MRGSLEQRLWTKIAKASKNECWPWLAHRNEHGYGTIQSGRKSLLAHRIVYELVHGPFPMPMKVLHRCDNPACCNPAHLWLGTQADNIADMNTKGRNGNIGRRMTADAIIKREITFARNKSRFGRKMTDKTKEALNRDPQKRWETRRKTFVSLASSGRWSLKYERCIACGTTERRHDGGGFCWLCYRQAKPKVGR
jgi:hypothetical protein